MIRNLIYNVCPLLGAEQVTRDNIALLMKYAQIFTGRKIVLIKTGEGLEDPGAIIPLFGALTGVEFRSLPNDPQLGEMVGFLDAWDSLESLEPDEITFYAHTKGVSPHNRAEGSDQAHADFTRYWYERMYRYCLEDPKRIDRVMNDYEAAGCFKMRRWEDHTAWIYGGAFYWVRHDALFYNPRRFSVPICKWTPEAYFLQNSIAESNAFDLFTEATINCSRCGMYNYRHDRLGRGSFDPHSRCCPRCRQLTMVGLPTIPSMELK